MFLKVFKLLEVIRWNKIQGFGQCQSRPNILKINLVWRQIGVSSIDMWQVKVDWNDHSFNTYLKVGKIKLKYTIWQH